MVVEFLTTGDCMLQHGEKPARSFEDFGDWIDESLVVTRLMLRDRRSDRCHDVRGATLFRKENLNARACGLCRLDKDKIVFVRNDHRPVQERTGNTTQSIGRLVNAGDYSRNWRISRNLHTPSNDLLSETVSVRSHTENRR